MHTSRADTPTNTVVAVTGDVAAGDTKPLRRQLFDALSTGEHDLLLDTRKVTSFDDSAFEAFVAGRSEAKFRQHRVVVVDALDGVVATSLRRTGLIFRFPVYRDIAAADAGLAADRDAVALRSGAFGESPHIPSVRSRPATPEPSAAGLGPRD